MQKPLTAGIVLAIGALALFGCSPPSRLDQYMTCEGKTISLALARGASPSS